MALKELSAKDDELGDWRRKMEVRERMVESLKASDLLKSAEIKKLKRELRESESKVRHSSKEVLRGLQERDRAMVHVEAEHQATRHAKDQLEEEQLARSRFQEEYDRREVSLVEAQSRIAYFESKTHRSEVVEEYRHSIFEKAELAIAYIGGFDYLKAQLLTEMKSLPDRFHYVPRVANCLYILLDIEKEGGGLDFGECDIDEEESEDEAMRISMRRPRKGARARPGKLVRVQARKRMMGLSRKTSPLLHHLLSVAPCL